MGPLHYHSSPSSLSKYLTAQDTYETYGVLSWIDLLVQIWRIFKRLMKSITYVSNVSSILI